MKKIFLIAGVFLVITTTTNAQGLLGKLKDKVGQTVGAGGKAGDYYLPNAKDAKKDLESKDLEKIDFSMLIQISKSI
jgi:hypothetical protein